MTTTETTPTIQAGTEIITVARDGSNTASVGRFSFPIYCTAVYRAVARKSDGVLTWRRVGSYRDETAGRGVTGPMVRRAQARATERGVDYRSNVRHGMIAC